MYYFIVILLKMAIMVLLLKRLFFATLQFNFKKFNDLLPKNTYQY